MEAEVDADVVGNGDDDDEGIFSADAVSVAADDRVSVIKVVVGEEGISLSSFRRTVSSSSPLAGAHSKSHNMHTNTWSGKLPLVSWSPLLDDGNERAS